MLVGLTSYFFQCVDFGEYYLDIYVKEMHVFHLCPNMISFGGIQRF